MTTAAQVLIGASALAGVGVASAYYATYGVRAQWLGPADWRGRRDTGSVALTFDDGPTDDTEPILDALSAYGVPAAFFMIGRFVERHPCLARRVVECGHEVGNHSYSHPIYLYRTPRETYRQLARAQEVIAAGTGVRPVWSRPPCGVRTPAYFKAARSLGLRTVQWTVAGFDWKRRRASDIARDVVTRATAGSIILLHDGDSRSRSDRRETVAAVPAILDGLRARGFHVAPLARLLDRGDAL